MVFGPEMLTRHMIQHMSFCQRQRYSLASQPWQLYDVPHNNTSIMTRVNVFALHTTSSQLKLPNGS